MTENIQPQIAKFISSQQMGSSEIQERAISLGKALVQELELEPGVDTLSRWMAHYVAEQIAIAENSTGDDKFEAEQRCFETILKLWERRASLPNGRYAFKNFESIFEALNRLAPENSQSYYFHESHFQSQTYNEATSESQADEIQRWIDIALGIDRTARVLINFAFNQAVCHAADEKTIAWLEKGTGISNDNDVSIINHFRSEIQEDDFDEETLERIRQSLRSRIKKLHIFRELSSILRDELIQELENI